MSKQVKQVAKKKSPAVSKVPARKAGASKQIKMAPAASGSPGALRSKSAATKKVAQRKEASAKVKVMAAAKSEKKAARTAVAPSKPAQSKPVVMNTKTPAPKSEANVALKTVTPKADAIKAAPDKKSAPHTAKKAPASPPKAPASGITPIVTKVEKSVPSIIAPHKTPSEFDGFKVNDHVVYPTHGVGKIVAVETQEIAGTSLELFVIVFDLEKMTLRVPLGKAKAVGMRILSSRDTVRTALKTLRGRARIKRTMWSRRAQEYEAKINSGDLLLIAEVVRDLHRAEGQPEQSYSERQIYESALERLAREVGAVEELDTGAAMERVGVALKKAA